MLVACPVCRRIFRPRGPRMTAWDSVLRHLKAKAGTCPAHRAIHEATSRPHKGESRFTCPGRGCGRTYAQRQYLWTHISCKAHCPRHACCRAPVEENQGFSSAEEEERDGAGPQSEIRPQEASVIGDVLIGFLTDDLLTDVFVDGLKATAVKLGVKVGLKALVICLRKGCSLWQACRRRRSFGAPRLL